MGLLEWIDDLGHELDRLLGDGDTNAGETDKRTTEWRAQMRGYKAVLRVDKGPWEIQIEPAAFTKNKHGESVALDLEARGFCVNVLEAT